MTSCITDPQNMTSAPKSLLDVPICEFFARCVDEFPQRVALVENDRQLTYRQLDESASQIAERLRAAGVRKGDIVGLFVQRSSEAIAAIIGILKVGAAYLPFDVSYPPNLLRYIYEDSRPKTMILQPQALELAGIQPFWDCASILLDKIGVISKSPDRFFDGHDRHGEDLAYVMYTSGSTGRPKGVLIPNRGVVRLIMECNFADLGPDQVILQLAPLSFDASTLEIWGALLKGGKLVVLPTPHPSLDEIAETIKRHRITTMWLTAGLFHLMVEHRLDGLRPLRQLIVGGDVLSPRRVTTALRELPDCRLINGYGPTENTTFTCCFTIPRDHDPDLPISIGAPVARTEVFILDEELRPVAEGEEGELCTGGAGLALGYLNRPDLTCERFIGHPHNAAPDALLYRTGDRVRRRADGNLEFLGRIDRQIKVNGKRVELDEIETCLRRSNLVSDAAVISRKDETGRTTIVAFATRANGTITLNEIRDFLRQEMPHHMVPSSINFVDRLPLSPTGKVDRAQLAAMAPGRLSVTNGQLRKATETQTKLTQLWKQILGVENIGADDNFFDLGGTSLQLIELHAALRKDFPQPVSVVDLFRLSNIRLLAAQLDQRSADRLTLISARERANLRNAALHRMRREIR